MVKKRTRRRHPRIGWREWVNLPGLGVTWIKAKVDTGAATSAIHAEDIEPFRRRGADWVRFTIHPKQRSKRRMVRVEAPLVEWRGVRSSNGQLERRPVIETTIRIGSVEWSAELTLSNRDQMGFRMLLGRSSLKGHFVVDCGASFLGPEPMKRAKELVVENGNGNPAPEPAKKPVKKAKAAKKKVAKKVAAKSVKKTVKKASKKPSAAASARKPRVAAPMFE